MKRSQVPIKKNKPLSGGISTLKRGSGIKKKPKSQKQLEMEQMTRDADKRFYEELWKKRGPYSEISGTFLGKEVNKACIHHIHSKAKHPIFRYHEENCILLTITEHADVEANPSKYPEINKRKEEFKKKYM